MTPHRNPMKTQASPSPQHAPARYDPSESFADIMIDTKTGDYVLYEDYARLAAVNGELVAALEAIKNGDYDNAHDPKAAAHIARAALARAGGAQ